MGAGTEYHNLTEGHIFPTTMMYFDGQLVEKAALDIAHLSSYDVIN